MHEIEAFVREHAQLHPELLRQVPWPQVRTIAKREGVSVRQLPLSRPGRLVRFGGALEIQLSDQLSVTERAVVGVNELVHFWRDRLDESALYSSNEEWEREPKEDFANVLAWCLTSPNRRMPLRGTRE